MEQSPTPPSPGRGNSGPVVPKGGGSDKKQRATKSKGVQPSSQSSDPERALAVSRGASRKDLLRAADDEVHDMRVPARKGAKKGNKRGETDEEEQVDGEETEDGEVHEKIIHSDDDDGGGGDGRRSH